MITLNILTRCTRQTNLLKIKDTVYNTDLFKINWYILFDVNAIKDIDAQLLGELSKTSCIIKFMPGIKGDFGYGMINTIIEEVNDWVYILDDDNVIHEDFYKTLFLEIENNPDKKAFVFNQKVAGLDFTGLDVRLAAPENMHVGGIDVAQFCIHKDLISDYRFGSGYVGDGIFITNIYPQNKEKFFFINQELCYYNWFDSKKKGGYSLPRILLIGTEEPIEMFSEQPYDYESKELNVKHLKTDKDIDKVIAEFNPDSIVTVGKSFMDFPNLATMPFQVRRRWMHLENIVPNIGDIAYRVANNFILGGGDENNPLVSFFSPIYNTADKLYRTYEALRAQTYNNWEWVMVNDSTDGGRTLLIAEELSAKDSRLKLYDFRKKSGGIIGESKHRAAALCEGDYIMEIDHDDYLLPEAADLMVKAFKRFPDAKFVYSDCAEVWEHNHESITYGEGFCFGYGSYRDEVWDGINYKVMNTANINPKTIRHIVGVPNHFRAWDRKFYLSIGGHNRRLTIADDYELIVRTFLKTKMVRIPKLLYLQFYHNNNTQNQTRADIQRRVKSIREHYNEAIHQRFLELGVVDWAYDYYPPEPLWCDSKFGEEENYVNYTYNIDLPTLDYSYKADTTSLGYML